MMIGVYVLLPILNLFFEFLLDKLMLQIYFFALWFILTCIPIYINIPLLSLLQQTSLFGYAGYFLLGGIFMFSKYNYNTTVCIILYILGVASTFLLTYIFSNESSSAIETAYIYFAPNVLLASVTMFIILKKISIPKNLIPFCQFISDKCFLIYFVHVIILEYMNKIIFSCLPNASSFYIIPITAILTFIFSLIVAIIIRLFPRSKIIFG